MAVNCYICGSGSPKDACYSCNNCGGLVCEDHGYRCHYSKNCWCQDCLPTIAADVLDNLGDAIENNTLSEALLKQLPAAFVQYAKVVQAGKIYSDEPMIGTGKLLKEVAAVLGATLSQLK